MRGLSLNLAGAFLGEKMKQFLRCIVPILVSLGCGLALAQAPSPSPSRKSSQSLDEWRQNPRAYYQRIPQKSDATGVLPRKLQTYFRPADLSSQKFVEKKQEWRESKFELIDGRSPLAALGAAQRPENLVDKEVFPLVKTLEELEEQGLRRARLKEVPWSGDYWAISRGILGARPFVPEFTRLESWQKRFDWILGNGLWEIFESGNVDEVMHLSAAEKMDLLYGDRQSAFTTYMWKQGSLYKDENGNVEDWMGICHGWAPAAYMVPRPTKAIQLKAFDGKMDIKLFPSEIKGLVTQLWATSPFTTKHLGGRCNKKDPARDENGRLTDPECFDVNPATWHQVVTNQLGRAQRSFVLDATYDYEVWNQPVYAYEYFYFNPETKKTVKAIAEAAVTPEQFKSDPFRKYRGEQVNKIVGIVMRVGYIVELGAAPREEEGQDWDQIHWVEYLYDLELSERGEITGGEWYSQAHPDFLWGAAVGARPHSPVDRYLADGAWSPDQPLPQLWRDVLIQVAPYGHQPAKFLEMLVEKSR